MGKWQKTKRRLGALFLKHSEVCSTSMARTIAVAVFDLLLFIPLDSNMALLASK